MKIIIDTNQFSVADVPKANRLKADGVMASALNSPGLEGRELRLLIDRINNNLIFSTEGGIDVHQLLEEPNWTGGPRNINRNRQVILDCGRSPSKCMVYYEFVGPDQRGTILTPPELEKAWVLEGKIPLLPLTRNWVGDSRNKCKAALNLGSKKVAGIFFELAVDVPLIKNQNIVKGIEYVVGAGKECWVMLSGKTPSTVYSLDVKATLRFFKDRLAPAVFDKCYFILAAYEIENKGISFFDGVNSVEAALKEAKKFK